MSDAEACMTNSTFPQMAGFNAPPRGWFWAPPDTTGNVDHRNVRSRKSIAIPNPGKLPRLAPTLARSRIGINLLLLGWIVAGKCANGLLAMSRLRTSPLKNSFATAVCLRMVFSAFPDPTMCKRHSFASPSVKS